MTQHGILKVALASPEVHIGNPLLNVEPILNILNNEQSGIVLFPELSITGYTSGDLFFQADYIKKSMKALKQIMEQTTFKGVYILGMPLKIMDALYNVALVIQDNKILGAVPKYYLPNSREFGEKRWFQSGISYQLDSVEIFGEEIPFGHLVFKDKNLDIGFGVEICQDMWAISSPGDSLSLGGAHLILNLSASPENMGKPNLRKHTVLDASRSQLTGYLYSAAATSESTTDLVFSPHKIAALLGNIIAESNLLNPVEVLHVDMDIEAIRYQRRIDSTFRDEQNGYSQKLINVDVKFMETEDYQFEKNLNKHPFLPNIDVTDSYCLVNEIQVQGLTQKLKHLKGAKVIVGISGGLDSTLALLVAHQAMIRLHRDPKDIIAVTLPSKVTSNASKSDAIQLMESLGVTALEIPIESELKVHLESIQHEASNDVTYENAQARIRTLMLMNLANKHGGFVLGTGDLSEIALGWMTFNGDHMSMYNVNAGVPKTLVQALIKHHISLDFKHLSEVLGRILNRPISPELKEDQKTEDEIGTYEINDFMLYHFLYFGASEEKLAFLVEHAFGLSKEKSLNYASRLLNRFYQSQFKRQVMPEGPKVLKVSLSPRGDLRLPSDIRRK
jgi:NAD+ synthase (glutamine-hydrolysing)